MYVLQFGQYYQNPGFHRNRIADLLSAAHPDINFTGVRVNNCPLD
ncbi:hypothetical protein JIX56_17260 [Streptomyces sp. CA-210063]|nr:hypothetical protein [Streptomyces sp. CA-210063]UUU31514.1 hypothetical protein JIX56_17260 [Streptomyces sp. CA-210063]